MQQNGFKIFVTLALLALSFYYLYPTARNYFVQQDLNGLEEEERTEYLNENFETVSDLRERALKLGLDLQGGMHVTLEVRIQALLRALAVDTDAAFERALEATAERTATSDDDFVEAFVEEFEAIDPEVRLSRYFRNADAEITRRSSNDEVAEFLSAEVSDALTRAVSIVRERVDRFGVSEPSIQRQGARRIVVELPGVTEPQRVRELLRGTARLEFRLMADPVELTRARNQAFAYFEDAADQGAAADTAAADSAAVTQVDTAEVTDVSDILGGQDQAAEQGGNPLLRVLQPLAGESVIFGAVAERDTAEVRALLSQPGVRELLPPGVTLMYTAKPEATAEGGQGVYYLLGVRDNVEMTGEVITDARPDFDPYTNEPEVSMTMNGEGAQMWSRITGANVGKPVAVVMDNVVYSWPRIIDKIPSGRTSITGVSRTEAEDVVTILKSGALPAPVDIIEERTVGPSLGAASIRAGTISVLVGLALVIVFMVLYYQTAGLIANVALLLNILFVFGILAAFGATLTLPGIAGIVLTIGMAVDANVLIFERIREEMTTGKTLKAAIDAGYAQALSAIADANITTFFVGVILFSFGVGPIQGFAVTLMAGIVSSLFTAIVVTRVLFDWLVSERKSAVSFG